MLNKCDIPTIYTSPTNCLASVHSPHRFEKDIKYNMNSWAINQRQVMNARCDPVN